MHPDLISAGIKYGIAFNSLYLGFFHASTLPPRHAPQMHIQYFQFPLLGIFPCIFSTSHSGRSTIYILSIPFTWDFSMHHRRRKACIRQVMFSFNSLYLGFFHASQSVSQILRRTARNFQFPLLGIFPCILTSPLTVQPT